MGPLAPLLCLLLAGAPGLRVGGVTVYSTVGGSVGLPCENLKEMNRLSIVWVFSQNPGEPIFLSKDKTITVRDPERAGRLRVGPDWSLHIRSLRPQDSGLYTCVQYAGREYYRSGTTATLYLLSLTASPSGNLRTGSVLTLRCGLDCGAGLGSCSRVPEGLTVSWRRDQDLVGKVDTGRSQIRDFRTYSQLSVTLQRSDHNKNWVCVLAKGTELKTYDTFTSVLTDYTQDLYSSVGGFLQLPCVDTVRLGRGDRLQWSFRRSGTITYHALFTLLGNGSRITGMEVDGDRVDMTVNSSLLIRSVQTGDSGVYLCLQNKDNLQEIQLNTLSVSSDPSGVVQRGSNVTLTCLLTCSSSCDETTRLLWRNSTGDSLQGGASERTGNTVSSTVVLEPQSSERMQCSVMGDRGHRVSQEWTIGVSLEPEVPDEFPVTTAVSVAGVFCALLVLATVAFLLIKRRHSRAGPGVCVTTEEDLIVYASPTEPTSSPVRGGEDVHYASVAFQAKRGGPGTGRVLPEDSDAVIYSDIREGR
ncbi:uncharacterized protein [Lepisosteus oculatus]|uniref:uncharacterized protein isoform X2 n=1 Tax=Lepisosteus oculatus TaxID=7918 RepID=UPI0035F52CCC